MSVSASCALCGLPCVPHPVHGRFSGNERSFCCLGCLNVHSILVESGVVPEGGDFRNTELFRRSLKLGLVSNREDRTETTGALPSDTESREAMFRVSGMWCASCAWLIERAVKAERGVVSAEVLFACDLVKVRYCPQYLPPGRIPERIRALGYGAEEYRGIEAPAEDRQRRNLLLRTGVAAFLWLNVMTLSMVTYVGYFGETVGDSARRYVPFVLMGLSAPCVFWSAWPILRMAWMGLRERVFRADSLLALGIVSAWLYSAVAAFASQGHVYFDTACAITTLVLAGKLMEHAAKQKTMQSLAFLRSMMPRKARVLDGEGRERFVSVEAAQPGMTLLVKAGERIPADGMVEEGDTHVDESVLTGESTPVAKHAGSAVTSGSLNSGSVIRMRVTRAAGESTLSQMVRAVECALMNRSSVERAVDRVSRVFVPVVGAVALATMGLWMLAGRDYGAALSHGISVLVIACPCALGIATPLALTAAIGAASRRGVLVNDARVLETVRNIDVLVLDKTGTVTEGDFCLLEMAVSRVAVTAGKPAGAESDCLAMLAAVESQSEHPLGRAVVRRASEEGVVIPVATGVEVKKGTGITGRIGDHNVFAGSRRMAGVIDADLDSRAREWEQQGLSTAFFGWDGEVIGALAFGDRVRDGAHDLVGSMKQRGVRALLVSGDSAVTTEFVARTIGISEFRGEVLPGEKSEIIRELQRNGSVVAMAGDGVNDAPALAQADLGIALGSGADLSMNAARMVLMNNSLGRIPEVFDLASGAFRIVRQNLFWAFFYNTAGIALAVAGSLTPILATAAMVLSSLSVIGNSLRLRKGLS